MSEWNRKMIDEFRAKGGKNVSHPYSDRILLLTVKGAKTGREQTVPLAYSVDDGRYVVAASKGGAPRNPDWYRNLVARPEAELEVGTERFEVKATALPKGPERDRLWEAHSTLMPGFRDYVSKTKRTIPVVVLERAS